MRHLFAIINASMRSKTERHEQMRKKTQKHEKGGVSVAELEVIAAQHPRLKVADKMLYFVSPVPRFGMDEPDIHKADECGATTTAAT